MGQKVLLLDLDACSGCRSCMVACSTIKENVSGLRQSRLWVPKIEAIGLAVPLACEQCASVPCAKVCPTKAISRNRETGAYVVDPDKCTACGKCVMACPFGAITVRKELAVKCDLCEGDPECAKTCTPGALRFIDLETESLEKKKESLEKRVEALANEGFEDKLKSLKKRIKALEKIVVGVS